MTASPKLSDASLAEWLSSLPAEEQQREFRSLAQTQEEWQALEYDWSFWGRPKQFAPPGSWQTWLISAGRGFGKTRTGAEWIRDQVEAQGARIVGLFGATAADVRDVMVEGESGILAVCPPWNRPKYEPSKRRLTWPNGAIGVLRSADEPNRLRGPQYFAAWADELAAWRYPDAWDQIQFGLRLGDNPRVVVTTTPRPIPLVRAILADPGTRVTTGSTYENAGNLAATFLSKIIKKYEGTRLGLQELYAHILGDTPGALWTRDLIEVSRISPAKLPKMLRIVVAIDPSVSEDGDACEAGIVVAGLGEDQHGYLLEDATLAGSPDTWIRRAIQAYDAHGASRIVAEKNNGGALIEALLRSVRLPDGRSGQAIPYRALQAQLAKRARAEPVSALYEQKRVHHVGAFPQLEDQLCTWQATSGEPSPDRLDAAVWALTELMLEGEPARLPPANQIPRMPARRC